MKGKKPNVEKPQKPTHTHTHTHTHGCLCKIIIPIIASIAIINPSYSTNLTGTGNECTESTLNTTTGPATLRAQWTLDSIVCGPGKYLNKTTAECVTCQTGKYCPGGTFNVEMNGDGSQNCPNGFSSSDSGVSDYMYCYRSCANADVSHATGVSGRYYYNSNNQCGAISCTTGYHIEQGINVYEEFFKLENISSQYVAININGQEYNNPGSLGLTENGTWARRIQNFGLFKGVAACVNANVTANWNNLATYPAGAFFGGGSGPKCFCQLTSFTYFDNNREYKVFSQWVEDWHGHNDVIDNKTCVQKCADRCAYHSTSGPFASPMYSSVGTLPSSCEPNSITLDWDPKNGGTHTENQCTYDGAVTLPTQPSKEGYTFGGWRVVQQ